MLKAACILLFVGLAASESSVSSVVSRILSQAKNSRSRSPVVLIINSRALEDSSSVEEPVYHQSSEESGVSALNMLLAQLQKSRPKPTTNRYQARPYAYQAPYKTQGKRYPVYKSLLSLRNSLRCGARDECKDECSELPKKKEKKCKIKCEVTYQCTRNVEPKCDGSSDCDEEGGSTKAPPHSDENQNDCPRC